MRQDLKEFYKRLQGKMGGKKKKIMKEKEYVHRDLKPANLMFVCPPEVAAEPCALFCAEDSNSCHLEVYPRVDGSVYLCGIGGSDHVRGARLREGGDLQDASLMKANPDRR